MTSRFQHSCQENVSLLCSNLHLHPGLRSPSCSLCCFEGDWILEIPTSFQQCSPTWKRGNINQNHPSSPPRVSRFVGVAWNCFYPWEIPILKQQILLWSFWGWTKSLFIDHDSTPVFIIWEYPLLGRVLAPRGVALGSNREEEGLTCQFIRFFTSTNLAWGISQGGISIPLRREEILYSLIVPVWDHTTYSHACSFGH